MNSEKEIILPWKTINNFHYRQRLDGELIARIEEQEENLFIDFMSSKGWNSPDDDLNVYNFSLENAKIFVDQTLEHIGYTLNN